MAQLTPPNADAERRGYAAIAELLRLAEVTVASRNPGVKALTRLIVERARKIAEDPRRVRRARRSDLTWLRSLPPLPRKGLPPV